MLDKREDAVEIDGDRAAPLRILHLFDGLVLRGPDAVIGDKNVQASETVNRAHHQVPRRLCAGEIAGDCGTVVRAECLHQFIGLRFRFLVAENNSRARCYEHSHRSRADAPRTASDESDLAREGEIHMK